MARIWKEKLDPKRHIDYMVNNRGGIPPEKSRDNLITKWVYFVDVCSFTFQFQSIDQLETCLAYFSQKPFPPNRSGFINHLEPRYWHGWYERLPIWLKEEPKRLKVVKALERALTQFEKEASR